MKRARKQRLFGVSVCLTLALVALLSLFDDSMVVLAQSESTVSTPKTPDQNEALATNDFRAVFSSKNTGIVEWDLLTPRFQGVDGNPHHLVSVTREAYLPAQLIVNQEPLATGWEVVKSSNRHLVFKTKLEGFEVTRTYKTGKNPYTLISEIKIKNTANKPKRFALSLSNHHYVSREDEESPGLISRPSPEVSRGVCFAADELWREDRSDLEEETVSASGNINFAGFENQYFANVIVATNKKPSSCTLNAVPGVVGGEEIGSLMITRLAYPKTKLSPGKTESFTQTLYLGPKDRRTLKKLGHNLEEIVDLGWFGFIGRSLTTLLEWIHGFVGNWGLAIIFLTLIVRILLLPLTAKSFKSMAKMRLLKPEIDRINEQYKEDPTAKGAATMELWKKEGVNPVSGCLPMLLQMPIWFALYQSIFANVDLYHQPFFGPWTDLSAPDPYYILPLAYGALMFLQQKLNPAAMDATQQKIMMYMMPIGLTIFLLFLPLALGLYMVTQSILGITQQKFINWRLDQVSEQKDSEALPS